PLKYFAYAHPVLLDPEVLAYTLPFFTSHQCTYTLYMYHVQPLVLFVYCSTSYQAIRLLSKHTVCKHSLLSEVTHGSRAVSHSSAGMTAPSPLWYAASLIQKSCSTRSICGIRRYPWTRACPLITSESLSKCPPRACLSLLWSKRGWEKAHSVATRQSPGMPRRHC